ncbi:MAG TPA: lamin tail domain-containing protein, partial [Clostridia bacterium]|nr:lamin tail domain-containing protein [Clostridia bacterium]
GTVTSSDGREHFVTEQVPTLGSANAGPKIGPVVINEIMYAPPPFGLNANHLGEFIELKNITAQPVPLFDPAHPTNTWRLGGGMEFTFPPGVVVEPGALLVVVGFDPVYDPAMLNWFRSYYQVASDASIYGPFEGNLANEGETLALYLPDKPELPGSSNPGFVPSVLVEAVDYSHQPPWPADTDGTGNSLGRIGAVFGNDPIHWQAGAGSPGRQNQGMVGQDTDEDGMPDDWELAHGLDPHSGTEAHGALGDLDQDGATNMHEYLAGTHPNDATDLLRFEIVTLSNGYCVFDFNVRSGRTYTVERLVEAGTTNWLPLVENIVGNDTTFRVRDPLNQPGQSSRYYRVKMQLE